MGNKPKSPHLTRRDFTKIVSTFIGSIIGLIAGIPIIGYVVSPAIGGTKEDDWISLGLLENYEIDKPTLFTFTRSKVNGWERSSKSYGVYVLKQNDTDVQVVSNICTHLSCRVKWVEETESYNCPCHDAKFGKTGEVLFGPPPRALDEFEHKIEEGILSIHLIGD